jgi:hypothetical protein
MSQLGLHFVILYIICSLQLFDTNLNDNVVLYRCNMES